MGRIGYYIRRIMPRFFYPVYIKYKYKKETGKSCNLDNPYTYTEKIQWSKLYRNDRLLSELSDKIKVRRFVADRIGEEYLIPTFDGIYDSADDIDIDKLPNTFVLKVNTGSGYNIIVNDKKSINWLFIRKKLNGWLKNNFAYETLELHYKNIKPYVYIEKNILEDGMDDLPDYKFFCFDGKVFCSYTRICTFEGHDGGAVGFFDRDYNQIPYFRKEYRHLTDHIKKPNNYEEMVIVAELLSEGFSHVRVDLYNIEGKIYFGEMTFTTASGLCRFEPDEFDRILGDQWNLNSGI